MITGDILRKALPTCLAPDDWAAVLDPAMQAHGITTKMRAASFLAQAAHESQSFNKLLENLFFRTASRLVTVWPKRFSTEADAAPYVANPEALANHVYANRMGNGNPASGDGFRYRGRGLIQTTGRSNYAAAGQALQLDLIQKPSLLEEPEHAAMSAAYFWRSHGLNELADDKTDDNDLEDFTTITVRINGGKNGLKERFALYQAFERAL